MFLQINVVKYNVDQEITKFTRIYKWFDPIFSPICYYSLIFALLWISIGLSVFGFVANKYKRITIHSLLTIHNIRSGIQWAITKVILNYLTLPINLPLINMASHHPILYINTLFWDWINQYWTGLKCVSFIEKPKYTKIYICENANKM